MVKLIDDSLITAQTDSLAQYQQILGRTIAPADPEMLLVNAHAYLLSSHRATINGIVNAQLLPYATGPVLEDKAAWFGGYKLPASTARTTMQYTIVSGAPDLVIPEGNRVKSQDGAVIFKTIADTIVAAGTLTVNIDAVCQETGVIGNNYTAGTISQIIDPLPYVSAAANMNTSTGGSDQETDDQLRARIPLLPSTFSVAGPVDAYKAFALSANPAIVDVAMQAGDGIVNLYILLDGGVIPNSAILDEVAAVLNDDKVRPQTDTVNVYAPDVITYTIDLTLYRNKNTIGNVVTGAATTSVNSYVNQWKNVLGIDVVVSKIVGLAMVEGAYRCVVNSPVADISILPRQYARCTGVVIRDGGIAVP